MSTGLKEARARVTREPVSALMPVWINSWGYNASADVYFSTATGCATPSVKANVVSVKWDKNRLTIGISFNSPCTTNITRFVIRLREYYDNFGGLADIDMLSDSVTANQAYTIYYSESIVTPGEASLQYS